MRSFASTAPVLRQDVCKDLVRYLPAGYATHDVDQHTAKGGDSGNWKTHTAAELVVMPTSCVEWEQDDRHAGNVSECWLQATVGSSVSEMGWGESSEQASGGTWAAGAEQ